MAHRFMRFLKDNTHARTAFDAQKCGNTFVIGAGFGRTGTTSLQVALQQLGFNSYHSTTVGENPQDAPLWLKAAELKKNKLIHNNVTSFNEWYQPNCQIAENELNWDHIFQSKSVQKYNATVGGPSIPFYMDILKFYENDPYNYNVKVIFTQRADANTWYKSFMGSIAEGQKIARKNWLLRRILLNSFPLKVLESTFISMVLGTTIDEGYDEGIKERYTEWNKAVIDNIPSDKLLIFDVREGWEPLCKFLGVSVPDTEFPRSNETRDMKRMNTIFRIVGITANGIVLVVIVGVVSKLVKSGTKKQELQPM